MFGIHLDLFCSENRPRDLSTPLAQSCLASQTLTNEVKELYFTRKRYSECYLDPVLGGNSHSCTSLAYIPLRKSLQFRGFGQKGGRRGPEVKVVFLGG